VLGRIGFDAKGDVTDYDTFVWYVWKDGEARGTEQADGVSLAVTAPSRAAGRKKGRPPKGAAPMS
jgi:hypothetical protein